MMMRRGFFITLEGPEGSGKSSQARLLAQALRRRGRRVVALRDPGSTALGRALRRVLLHSDGRLSALEEALLFIGGRSALVQEHIAPALRRGAVVVCDRFHDATVVYQGFGGGVDVPWLDRLGRKAIGGVMPQLTVLLDLPAPAGFARLRRAHDRMERKGLAFHRRVRAGYLALARRSPKRFLVVDARQRPDAIHGKILQAVARRVG
jgi:dTMP kinase